MPKDDYIWFAVDCHVTARERSHLRWMAGIWCHDAGQSKDGVKSFSAATRMLQRDEPNSLLSCEAKSKVFICCLSRPLHND